MTAQEMKCMAKKYRAEHLHACGVEHDHGPASADKQPTPLSYTADGLIDASKVDLGGITGVSAEDQKAAEELLVATIQTLPKWSDYNQAVADGFKSIQDQGTGEEHLLHWDWIEDDVIFDPNYPESLVFKVDRATGSKTLEAAMFILPQSYTLDNPPAIDSPLLQFHLHDNLCFTAGDAPPRCRPHRRRRHLPAATREVQPQHPGACVDPAERLWAVRRAPRRRRRPDQGRRNGRLQPRPRPPRPLIPLPDQPEPERSEGEQPGRRPAEAARSRDCVLSGSRTGSQLVVMPPSMTSTWPVMKLAASLARNSAPFAISSGAAMRLMRPASAIRR